MTRPAAPSVLLGITGGIAAYKTCELIRLLVKEGCRVDAIMTKHACEFVTPLTIQTLTGNPVHTEMFKLIDRSDIGHIALAERPDVVVIAPATANIIGKMATGVADDLLSTVLLATRKPVLVAPAMNTGMWKHPAVRENIARIRQFCTVMAPESGDLACGATGEGRLPDPVHIAEMALRLGSTHPLEGRHVVVTAGPTIEEIDPVRFISNYSTGTMGYAIARAAYRLGAITTLITGPTSIPVPYGVRTIPVTSAVEMEHAVLDAAPQADILVMAAAVADYRPAQRSPSKVKKTPAPSLSFDLLKNPDIIAAAVKLRKPGSIFAGFAAETGDLQANATEKLTMKGLDIVFANDVTEPGAGFGYGTNRIDIVTAGESRSLPPKPKSELAYDILDAILHLARP